MPVVSFQSEDEQIFNLLKALKKLPPKRVTWPVSCLYEHPLVAGGATAWQLPDKNQAKPGLGNTISSSRGGNEPLI